MTPSNPHIFTILVSFAIIGLIVRLVMQAIGHKAPGKRPKSIYLTCFISGVLFANAIPHLLHGISGEHFPAPFGYLLGSGFAENLSNVIWGFINLVLGYNFLSTAKVLEGDKWRKIVFFAGFLAMAVFLSFIFSHPGNSFLRAV